jgi:hypothetical protein
LAEHTLHTISLADSLAKTLGLPFCLCSSSNLSRADLMAHAMAISEKLPDGAYAINLCQDRYLVFFIALGFPVLPEVKEIDKVRSRSISGNGALLFASK